MINARACAALAAALLVFSAASAAAQDPPPPMVPNDPPPEPPPPPPPPPPTHGQDPPPRAEPLPPLPPLTPPLAPPVTPPPGAPTTAHGDASARTLRGHKFFPPFLVDSPFITHTFGLTAEIGREWSPAIPTFGADLTNMSTHQGQYDQTVGATGAYASLGVAVTERVQLGLDASYATLLAGDVSPALLFGSKNAWGFEPGARIRLFTSESTQLSLRLYASFSGSAQQNVASILNEIANESAQIGASTSRQACLAAGDLACALTSSSYNLSAATLSTKTSYGGAFGLSLAHAFNSVFGFQASLGLGAGYASTTQAFAAADGTGTGGTISFGSVPVTFKVGVAPSLDFGPNVPLALMAEYHLTLIYEPAIGNASVDGASNALTLQNGLVFGAFYTGRDDFVVGARVNATVELRSNTTSTTDTSTGASTSATTQQPYARVAGQLTARYFF